MKQFSTWYQERKVRETADFGFDDGGRDYDQDLLALGKVMMAKYRSEYLDYLKELADSRNDGELKEMIKKINGGGTTWVRPNKEPDDVMAPVADKGQSPIE
jgi:vacuolar-type H+-ATPase subunit E/Vma4